MRTLIVSDFHLGARVGFDVLQRDEPMERLLAAVEDVDRLVLLGDIVELMGRPRRGLAAAAPRLRRLGRRLRPDAELIIVPGNHDVALIRPWLREHVGELRAANSVPIVASPMLEQVASWLGRLGRVRVNYPGVWLGESVWATHGHYLDRHLLPHSTFGVARGLLGRPPGDAAAPADYERGRRPSLRRSLGWLPLPLARAVDAVGRELRRAAMAPVQRSLVRRRFAPANALLLGLQVQHAALPALARVTHRLEIDADWVIFGHVHRLGPLAGDDPGQWQGPEGRPRLVNTGSWLYEPRLVGRSGPPHPYWPGGAVILGEGPEPRVVGLLDDLDRRSLSPPPS